jgi:hypothetical protein
VTYVVSTLAHHLSRVPENPQNLRGSSLLERWLVLLGQLEQDRFYIQGKVGFNPSFSPPAQVSEKSSVAGHNRLRHFSPSHQETIAGGC